MESSLRESSTLLPKKEAPQWTYHKILLGSIAFFVLLAFLIFWPIRSQPADFSLRAYPFNVEKHQHDDAEKTKTETPFPAPASSLERQQPNGSFAFVPLPWPEDALEPYISNTSVIQHYRLYAGYVSTLNDLLLGSAYKNKTLEEIVVTTAKINDRFAFENAAESFNHIFFFNSLKPGGGPPNDTFFHSDFGRLLLRDFVSFRSLAALFRDESVHHFASGWVWLVHNPKQHSLKVITTRDSETPLTQSLVPLLCVDLWEHAYLSHYESERGKYMSDVWDHLLNWEWAAQRYHLTRINQTREM